MNRAYVLIVCILNIGCVEVASAEPLTGTWRGSYSCNQTNNDGTSSVLRSRDLPGKVSVLEITQLPDQTIGVRIDGLTYRGRVIERANRSVAGVGVFVRCGSSDAPGGDVEVERFSWSLRGVPRIVKQGVYNYVDGIGACTGSWRRVSDTDPQATADCP